MIGDLEGLPAGHRFLDTSPPPEELLAFGSETGKQLKGRLIIYRFAQGWYVGRILKLISDATMYNYPRRRDTLV